MNMTLDADEVDTFVPICGDGTGAISATLRCGAGLEGTALRFTYSARQLSNGDVWSYGSIADASIEVGASSFYSVNQVGYATAPVGFTYDVQGLANGGSWWISVDRASLLTVVEYTDVDIVSGKLSWSLPSTANSCVLNQSL